MAMGKITARSASKPRMGGSKTAPSGKGMMDKTPGSMTNPQMVKKQSGLNDAAMKSQASSAKMEAMKSALARAASAAPKTPAGSVAAELTYKLPARIGDTGTKSNMPAVKGAPVKKKNLAE
jgi:hypothetical protein